MVHFQVQSASHRPTNMTGGIMIGGRLDIMERRRTDCLSDVTGNRRNEDEIGDGCNKDAW